MAFRKNKDDGRRWNSFLEDYKKRLTSLGLPEIAFRAECDWLYFIDHCYDADYPDLLNLDDWSSHALQALLPIFEDMHGAGFYAGEGSGVLALLRSRFKSAAEQD